MEQNLMEPVPVICEHCNKECGFYECSACGGVKSFCNQEQDCENCEGS